MARKLIMVAEAGIDAAVALACALTDPNLEVSLVVGAVGIEDAAATDQHLHALLEHMDPPKLPRYGAALPLPSLHEACTQQKLGLGNTPLPSCSLHNSHPGDKLMVEAARQMPGELTVLVIGPLTPVARAMDRDADFIRLLKSLIIVGGTAHGPGNAGPLSEFHFCCDPTAARQVIRADIPKTIIPLEIGQSVLFAPTELAQLTQCGRTAARLLRRCFPVGIHDLAQEQGLEGMFLADVFGVAFASNPAWFKARPHAVDVETGGELTRGMTVLDQRRQREAPNADWVHETDTNSIRDYLLQTFN